MSALDAGGRPHQGGSPDRMSTVSVPVSPDLAASLAANLELARSLARTIDDQRAEVEAARRQGYHSGYRDGYGDGFATGDLIGYGRAEWEMDQEWADLAEKIRALGGPLVRTHAERRSAELEACAARPGDFLGRERDPGYLDRFRTSLERVAMKRRAAA